MSDRQSTAAELQLLRAEIKQLRDALLGRRQAVEWSDDERAGVVVTLRALCADFGDNDWPDDLDIADVIEKHLSRHLYEKQLEEDGDD